MAVSLVQNKISAFTSVGSSYGTGIPQTVAYTSSVTSGNLLILVHTSFQWHVNSISDSQGNTWTQAVFQEEGGSFNDSVGIWYAVAGSSGANTVSPHYNDVDGDDHGTTVAISEWSGTDSSPLDTGKTNSALGTGTAVSPGAVTPSANGYLIIGVGQNYNGSNNTVTYNTGSGYAKLDEQLGDGSTYNRLFSEYYIQTTAASTTASYTLGGSSDWVSAVAVFKAATVTAGIRSMRQLVGHGQGTRA